MNEAAIKTGEQLIEAARAMSARLRERSDEIEQARSLPDDLTREMIDAGFFKMLLAREYGGLEVDAITAVRVVETISTANAAAGWVVMIASGQMFWVTGMMPGEAVRELLAPDPDAIMVGVLFPHGKAVKTDGGYRVSGRWPFGSGCHQAAWFASGCLLFDGNRPVHDENGNPQMALCVTPASDCQILDTWNVVGLRGTGSHDYLLDNVFVPERRVVGHFMREPSLRCEPRYSYQYAPVAMMPAVSLGIARAAIDELRKILDAKMSRLVRKPGSYEFEALAKAEALVGSARAYLYATLKEVCEASESDEGVSNELRSRFWGANTHAVTSSVEAVDLAYNASGSAAIYAGGGIERHFRDAHTASTHIFTRPSTMEEAGSILFGIEPVMRLV